MAAFLVLVALLLVGRLPARPVQRSTIKLAVGVWLGGLVMVFAAFDMPLSTKAVLATLFAVGQAGPYWAESLRPKSCGRQSAVWLLTLLVGIAGLAVMTSLPGCPTIEPWVGRLVQHFDALPADGVGRRLTHIDVAAHVVGLLLCLRESSAAVTLTLALAGVRRPTGTPYQHSALIGGIERLIVFVFARYFQFNAVAFILTAKGVARLHDGPDRHAAEYVLVGTLTSTLVSIAIALATARVCHA